MKSHLAPAEAEMGPRRAAARIAVPRRDEAPLVPAARGDHDLGPEGVPVAGQGAHREPAVAGRGGVVAEQPHLPEAADREVEVAVAVEIAEGEAAVDLRQGGEAARLFADVGETAAPAVLEEQVGLGVAAPEIVRARRRHRRPALHPAVDDGEVEIAVVIVIEETATEAGEGQVDRGHPGAAGGVAEEPAAGPGQQGVALVPEVGHRQVEAAVAVGVGDRHPHAPFRLAVAVEPGPPHHRLVEKGAVPLRDPELVGLAVVGDENVDPAVIRKVGAGHSQSPGRGVDSRGHRDVGELPRLVAVQGVAHAGELAGRAVVDAVRGAADHAGVVVDVVHGVEVEVAVAVVVDEGGRGAPAVGGEGGGIGGGEGAVAAVPVEGVGAVVGGVHVGTAIVVDVPGGGPLAVSRIVETHGAPVSVKRSFSSCR